MSAAVIAARPFKRRGAWPEGVIAYYHVVFVPAYIASKVYENDWDGGLPSRSRCCHMPPHRAFGCFSLLILNDRAAPSYQLLDLSLAGLPLDMLFFMTDLLSFEVGILVLSLGNCLPLVNQPHPTSLPLPRRRVIAPSQSVMLKVPSYHIDQSKMRKSIAVNGEGLVALVFACVEMCGMRRVSSISIVILCVIAATPVWVLDQLDARDVAAERRALDERAFTLKLQALMPGSAPRSSLLHPAATPLVSMTTS